MNKFYGFEKTTDTSANLYIYGDITSYEWDESDVSAFGFKQDLDNLGDVSEINVHINSLGGSTFQGLAIYNLLKQNKAKINTYVDGIAASSASIIAMAGDKIYIPKTGLIMIHNCWTWTEGNAKELRKTADDMDKIAVAYKEAYLSKIKIDEEKLNQLLDEETYLTADECVEMGFADEIIELKENADIKQCISTSILKLVNKAKNNEKKERALSEETLNRLAEEISNKMSEKIKSEVDKIFKKDCKGSATEEPAGLNNQNQIKEGSWESFFNTKNQEKEGKEDEN